MMAYANRHHIIQLICMLCFFLFYHHMSGYNFTEIVEYKPCPYFLNDEFCFLTMKIDQSDGVF